MDLTEGLEFEELSNFHPYFIGYLQAMIVRAEKSGEETLEISEILNAVEQAKKFAKK